MTPPATPTIIHSTKAPMAMESEMGQASATISLIVRCCRRE